MINLTCGNIEILLKFTPIEEVLLSKIHLSIKTVSVPAIMRLVWVSSGIHATSSPSEELRRTSLEMIEIWERDNDLLDYKYSHVYHSPGNQLETGPITKFSSGHRLADDPFHYYTLKNGHGHCDWEKCGITPDGRGILISVEDCRRKKTIITANHGPIKITKIKIKSNVGVKLKRIVDFLDASPGGEVTWFWVP